MLHPTYFNAQLNMIIVQKLHITFSFPRVFHQMLSQLSSIVSFLQAVEDITQRFQKVKNTAQDQFEKKKLIFTHQFHVLIRLIHDISQTLNDVKGLIFSQVCWGFMVTLLYCTVAPIHNVDENYIYFMFKLLGREVTCLLPNTVAIVRSRQVGWV